MKKTLSTALIAAAITLAAAQAAQASGLFADSTRSTCNTPNCAAAIIDKAVVISEGIEPTTGEAITDPWVGQFFSTGNECVRVEVITTDPQPRDMVLHLIGPDLLAWTDDDSGVGLLPRIEANTRVPGRYVVVVGVYSPTLTNTNTRFKLSYGRYPLGNPNCSEAIEPHTAPAASALSEKTQAR